VSLAAVSLAAQEVGSTEHLTEAEADVQRALEALRRFGLAGNPAVTLMTEYPLAMLWNDGKLLSGFIDLLALSDDTAMVIDFKTDTPVAGGLAAVYPKYAAQLRLYGDMLRTAGLVGARQLRLGLLLTATGKLRWL
jgi:ATP-dependent exoDNAse (exonuclease V) beta subunit